jgi:hypothetical protein
MEMATYRYVDRPELWRQIADLSALVWPEYNRHGDVLNAYWDQLYTRYPEYQFVVVNSEDDEVLAEGHTIPRWWDGAIDGLGSGIDHTLLDGFAPRSCAPTPNTLAALAVEVVPAHRGRGLSAHMLGEMRRLACRYGFKHLVAPVRPSLKEHFPLTAIEEYVRWRRSDGLPFDDWIRVHVRLGGQVARPLPHSLAITASIAEWENWTKMSFDHDDDYLFPKGLAPLHIECARDVGSYWEPNVWIIHATDD